MFQNDLKNIFHNTNEFAETKNIVYDNKNFSIPIIVTYNGTQDKSRLVAEINNVAGNAEGIFSIDLVIYIPFSCLGFMPKKGFNMKLDNDVYRILKVEDRLGEFVLYLERYDE